MGRRQRIGTGSLASRRAKIGATIRQLRLDRGWSVKDLGERVGIVPSQVSRWEHGSRSPLSDAMERLAAAFDVPVHAITGDDPEEAELVAHLPIAGTVGRKAMGQDGSARRFARAEDHLAIDATIAARWRGDKPGKLALWRCSSTHLEGFERGDLLAFVESEVAETGDVAICSVPRIGLWLARVQGDGSLLLPTGDVVRGKVVAVLRGMIR